MGIVQEDATKSASSDLQPDIPQSNHEARDKSEAEEQPLSGLKLVLVIIALLCAMFLVALVILSLDTIIINHNHPLTTI